MAEYGKKFSVASIKRRASLPEDVADSFLPEATEPLSLYGKRLHLTLYYQQKKHAYIYYLLWWTTAWIGGHLFYVNRAKEGFRRLLMPFYILILTVLGGIVSLLLGVVWDVLAQIFAVIAVIIILALFLGWFFSCFIELFSAVDYVNTANKVIAEAIAQRVASVDEV